MNENLSLTLLIQLNLSTMATLGTEKSGHCREVAVVESLKQSECMDYQQKKWLLVEVWLYIIGSLYSQITCLYLKFYEYPWVIIVKLF